MIEVYGREVCEKSFEEMKGFARFANSLGEKPLLFGGWAVWHYAPYAGSKDVDFIARDDKLGALIDFLAARGYAQREARLFKNGVFFDLYSESEEIGEEGKKFALASLFEGAQETYLKNYAARGVGERVEILLPSLPRLLYSKTSALASRSVAKDRSDATALLLKVDSVQLEEFKKLLSLDRNRVELEERLTTLRNDEENLALAAKPTTRNLNKLNAVIKSLTLNRFGKGRK